MPNTILLKKSNVALAVPSSLSYGELALNYADGKLYYKNSAGQIVPFTALISDGDKGEITVGGSGTTLTIDNGVITTPKINDALVIDCGIIQPIPPIAPAGLSATAGRGQLSLSWTAPASNGGSAITGYRVEYTPSGGSASTVNTGATGTTYTLNGLNNSTSYTVRVAALNAIGVGAYSAPVTQTTLPPILVISNAGGVTFSGAGTAASPYTMSGGLPIEVWSGPPWYMNIFKPKFTLTQNARVYFTATWDNDYAQAVILGGYDLDAGYFDFKYIALWNDGVVSANVALNAQTSFQFALRYCEGSNTLRNVSVYAI